MARNHELGYYDSALDDVREYMTPPAAQAQKVSAEQGEQQALPSLEDRLRTIDQSLQNQVIPMPDEFQNIVDTAAQIKYLGKDEATKEDTYCDESGSPIDADLAKRVLGAAKPERWVLDEAAKANFGSILSADSPKALKSGDPKNKSPLERQYDFFVKRLPVSDRDKAWTYFQGAAKLRLELSDALVANGATPAQELSEAAKADRAAGTKEAADRKATKKALKDAIAKAEEDTKAAQELAAKSKKEAEDAAAKTAAKPKNHVVPAGAKTAAPKPPKSPRKKGDASSVVPPVEPPKKTVETTNPDADSFKDIVNIDSRGRGHRNGGRFIKKQNLEMLMSDDIAAKIRDGAADWEKAKATGKVEKLDFDYAGRLGNDEAFDAAKQEADDRDRYGVAPSVLDAIENDPDLSATEKMAKLADLETAEAARKAAEAIKAGRSAADELAIFRKYGISADQYDALQAGTSLTDDQKQAKLETLELQTALSANRVAYDDEAVVAAKVFDKWGITPEQAEAIKNDPNLTEDEKNEKFAFLAAKQQAKWDAKAAARAAAGEPIPATAVRDMEAAHDLANADAPIYEKYGISLEEYTTLNADTRHTDAEKAALLADLERLTTEKNQKFAEDQAAEVARLAAEAAANPEQTRQRREGKFKRFFKKLFTREVAGTDERKVRKGRVAVAAGAVVVTSLIATDLVLKAKTGAGFLPDFFGGFGSGNGANTAGEGIANTPDGSILNGQGGGAGLDASLLGGGAEAANNQAPIAFDLAAGTPWQSMAEAGIPDAQILDQLNSAAQQAAAHANIQGFEWFGSGTDRWLELTLANGTKVSNTADVMNVLGQYITK